MRPLIPCSACARHVRASETVCPFCGDALAEAPARPQPARRLSRTAALVFGASVVVVGCGDETVITAGSSSSGGTTSTGSGRGTTTSGQGGMGQGGAGQGGDGQGGDGGTGQGGAGGMGVGGMGEGGGAAPLYGAAPPPPEE